MCNKGYFLHVRKIITVMDYLWLKLQMLMQIKSARSPSLIYGIVAVVTVVSVSLPVLYLVYLRHEYARGSSVTLFIYLFIPFVVPPAMKCILNTVPRYNY